MIWEMVGGPKKKAWCNCEFSKLEIFDIFLCTPVSTSGMKYHNLNLYIEQMNMGSLMKNHFASAMTYPIYRVIRGGI